jgi:hypothetical protein
MRRALLMIVLAMASNSVAAAWIIVGVTDDGTAYYDPASIRKTGDVAQMLDLIDYRKVQNGGSKSAFLSATSQSDYNCADSKTRLIRFTWNSGHMGAAETVFTNDQPGKWEVPPAGSVAEGLWKRACGKMPAPLGPVGPTGPNTK